MREKVEKGERRQTIERGVRDGQVDLAETDENGNENERENEHGNENEKGNGRQEG